MSSFEIHGLDELEEHFSEMEKNVESLGDSVSFEDLFNEDFLLDHSSFHSFEDFLKSGGFNCNNQEDFDSIPESDLDSHVTKTTDFSSWQDMLDEAGAIYLQQQLGF